MPGFPWTWPHMRLPLVSFALHSYAIRNCSCEFDCIVSPVSLPRLSSNLGVALDLPRSSSGVELNLDSVAAPEWVLH